MTNRSVTGVSIGPGVARAAGIGLVAYGLLGIVLIVVSLVIGGSALGRAERLTGSLSSTLTAAATTARSSTTALGNLRGGVAQSSTAADDAGSLVDQASNTSSQLAAAMSLSIFGTQPLLPMAANFNELSTQLQSLSTDLDSISSALDTSGTDLDRLRGDMERLTVRLEELTGSGGAAAIIAGGGLRLAFLALLARLSVPALGSLLLGAALLFFVRRPIVIEEPVIVDEA
jgi:hypothetical protein